MRDGPCGNQFRGPLRVKEFTFQGLGLLSQAMFEGIMVDIGLFCKIVVVRRTKIFCYPVAAVGKTAVWKFEFELDRGSKTPHILQGVINGFKPLHKLMLLTKLTLLSKPQAI